MGDQKDKEDREEIFKEQAMQKVNLAYMISLDYFIITLMIILGILIVIMGICYCCMKMATVAK